MSFCPKCKIMCQNNVMLCPNCKSVLVGRPSEDEAKYITVFVSDEKEEASKVKRILSENKISYITQGAETKEFHYVDFLVREDKLEEAQNLLAEIIDEESRPAIEERQGTRYISVFTCNIEEVDGVKRILDKNRIPYITKGEEVEDPWWVEFFVSENRFEDADSLLSREKVLDEAEKAESKKEMSPQAIRQDTFATILILIFVLPIFVIMFIPNMKNTTKYLSLGILVMISLGIIGLVGYFKGKKF